MIQRGDRFSLPAETLAEVLVRDFNGNFAAETGIDGGEDLPHAALAQQSFDPVGSQLRSHNHLCLRSAGEQVKSRLVKDFSAGLLR